MDVSFFADAFRDSPVASLILDASGNVLSWNHAAERLFGWSESEVLGKPLPFIPPEREEEHRQMRKRDLAGQGFNGRRITRVRKDGTLIELSVRTSQIRNTEGHVTGILSVYADISAEKRAEELSRLRQSLANEQLDKLERFYATAPIGLGFVDTDLRYVRVNERLAQIHGAPVGEHTGKRLGGIAPELAALVEPVCREVMATGIAVIEHEVRAATPALPGAVRDWQISFHPLKQDNGTVLGVSIVVSDVTERNRLNAQLKRQEKLLRLVIEGMPGLVGYLDRDFRYKFTNRRYAEWFRRPASEFDGKTVEEVVGQEALAVAREELERAMRGEPVDFERRLRYADTVRDVRAMYIPDCGPDGQVRGIVVLVQDVTEQKRAEQALRDSEERFRHIVEIAAEGIWIVDAEGRTTFANRRMAEMLGYALPDMMGRSFFEFLDPADVDRGRRHFERRKAGDRNPRDYRFHRKDGSVVWLDITATAMHDHSGTLAGILGMCTDVTERKQGEQQVRQTQKLESLGILAGGIAHDFNNLLVAIMGNASLALDLVGASTRAGVMLSDAILGCERAAQLTRQLLAYAGKDHGTSEAVNLAAMAKDLRPLLIASIPKLVDLTLELHRVSAVRADPAQLQQVLMNLVINAAESIPERSPGNVRVEVEQRQLQPEDYLHAVIPIEHSADEYVAVSVTDSGSGMDEGTQARIFDPFFTTKFDGRGLGLSAVLGIVKSHRGTLTLRSAPGKGTTFTVLLPVSTVEIQTPAPAPARAIPLKGSGTVLVVDDEASVRTMAQRALELHGYRVLVAEHGQAAIDLLPSHPEVRAAVLDLAMPVMSGDTAAPLLRAQRPDLRLILSSGYSESEATERFGKDVLNAFLRKPYTAATLVAKVAEMMEPVAN